MTETASRRGRIWKLFTFWRRKDDYDFVVVCYQHELPWWVD